MADDEALTPKPRPRRRRTDIDPNAPSPPVASERRRRKSSTAAAQPPPSPEIADVPVAAAAPTAEARADLPSDATVPFHVPGLAPIASVTTVEAPPVWEPSKDRRSWLPIREDRSSDPNVCPFLRAADDYRLLAPIETPDAANRCAALAEAVPQSLRQQELVCLSTGHVNCPRYLRGAAVAVETPEPVVRTGRSLSPAMLGSLVVLVMAFSASVGFVLARGGMVLAPPGPPASPSAPAIAVVSPSPAVLATPSPSLAATPSATPSPTVTPSPTPEPTATPSPTARPAPRSDRYALLTACPDEPRCWIYRVRSGDNVYSIARYFGVSMDSIYDRNPWLRDSGLRAGQQLRLPPPTR